MPAELHRSGFPGIAASAINANAAVQEADGGDRRFIPIASKNLRPAGVALATQATPLGAFTLMDEGNMVTVTAMASLGPGAEIGVASTNGALGIVTGASGSVIYSVGQSRSAAQAGEDFSLFVNPRQLSGLA